MLRSALPICLCFPIVAWGQVTPPAALPRIDPEVLRALEASADGRVYVIVVLKEPLVPSGARWDARRAAIRAQQDVGLARLSLEDFEPAYRYRHFTGLTGKLTATGLAKLAACPVVEGVCAGKVGEFHGRSSAGFLGVTQAREAYGITGKGYAVAVLDSGVDTDHPDLIDDLLPGAWTFLDAGATSHVGAEDDLGHGTAVSGIITGAGNLAPMGIAPDAHAAEKYSGEAHVVNAQEILKTA